MALDPNYLETWTRRLSGVRISRFTRQRCRKKTSCNCYYLAGNENFVLSRLIIPGKFSFGRKFKILFQFGTYKMARVIEGGNDVKGELTIW